MILEIIFWICVGLIFHSYVLYPLLLELAASTKHQNSSIYSHEDAELPSISIFLSVYNEEPVIEDKIRSTLTTNYPLSKIEFFIGSDCSNDGTNEIIKKLQQEYPQIKFFPFEQRQGKANIINKLVRKGNGDIYIFTDAKVFFTTDTIYQLTKHFKNPEIGMVGGNLINTDFDENGIAFQENAYMNREIRIKYLQGLVFGKIIGAFGACYALRPEYYHNVPERFIVDDFFITMKVLQKHGTTICEINAVCYENVPSHIVEEFRRKVRISTGNFQNLSYFKKLLFPPWKSLAFNFISHKVIRWFGPFILLIAYLSNALLALHNSFYLYIFIAYSATFFIPLIDLLFRNIKIHNKLMRFITHFYGMNIALAIGFFKFLKGVKTNVWQPSKRNKTKKISS